MSAWERLHCWTRLGYQKFFLQNHTIILNLFYSKMGGSFQDYSQIQIFEADFEQKVSLKMLN